MPTGVWLATLDHMEIPDLYSGQVQSQSDAQLADAVSSRVT